MTNIIYVFETIGIVSFALSGMLMADKKNFDPVGWYIIASVTAFGGGTVRDLILDKHPVYWIQHAEYPLVIFVLTILFYLLSKYKPPSSLLIVTDAMGLALFSVTSAQMILGEGHPLIIVLILGVISATFGGLIRDVLCGEVPLIFQKVSFYAFVSASGIGVYLAMRYFVVQEPISMGGSLAFMFVFRMLAIRYNLRFR